MQTAGGASSALWASVVKRCAAHRGEVPFRDLPGAVHGLSTRSGRRPDVHREGRVSRVFVSQFVALRTRRSARPRLRYRAAARPAPAGKVLGLSQESTTHKRTHFVTLERKGKRRLPERKTAFHLPEQIYLTIALLATITQRWHISFARRRLEPPAGTLTGMAARAGIAPASMIPHPFARL